MKKILFAVAALAFAGPLFPAHAEVTYTGSLVNDTAISIDSTYDLDLNKAQINRLSFTATYSSATMSDVASPTFTSGRPSTASITVANFEALIPRKSTFSISVMGTSTTTLRGQGVIINGAKYYGSPGGQWTPVTTATGNAVALAAAINANSAWEAVAVSTVVTATASVAGSFSTRWTITTNSTDNFRLNGTNAASASPLMGADRQKLVINGVTFNIANSTAVTNSSTTAKNISDTLMAHAASAAIFTSTWNAAGVITATSAANGLNAYSIFTSSALALNVNGSTETATTTFLNGSATNVSATADTITMANHELKTGMAVLLSTTATIAPPPPLTNAVTYYAIRVDGNTVKLATTKANAAAGTAINITADGATGGDNTLTVISMSGVPSFKWQVSNNGTSFADFTATSEGVAISSVTFTAAGSSAWDFGPINYRYLRLNYVAPTFGGIDITAVGNGQR